MGRNCFSFEVFNNTACPLSYDRKVWVVTGHNILKVFIDTNVLKWGLLNEPEILQKQVSERDFLLREVSAIRTVIGLARAQKLILFENMENTIEKMWTTNFRKNKRIRGFVKWREDRIC